MPSSRSLTKGYYSRAQRLASNSLCPYRIVSAMQLTTTNVENLAENRSGAYAIQAASMELYATIRRSVNGAIRNSNSNQPDWREQVLEPVVADFPDYETLAVDGEDAEYILLLGTAVFLGYEIIRQRGMSFSDIDRSFIDDMLVNNLGELEVVQGIHRMIEAEYSRLKDADLNISTTLWLLSAHFSIASRVIELRAAADEPAFPVPKEETTISSSASTVENGTQPKDSGDSVSDDEGNLESDSDTSSFNTTASPIEGYPTRDVHAKIFLKQRCSHEMHLVDSVTFRNDIFTIQASPGLTMMVEEGATVSDIYGGLDTVTVRAEGGTGCKPSAIVIIPPRYSYTVNDVLSIENEHETNEWTKVETTKAVILIGNGSYEILPVESEQRIFKVKNVYEVDYTS